MKSLQHLRKGIQAIGILLTILGLILNTQLTTSIILGLTIIAGAYYCGWLCPFGTLQEWIGDLGNRLGIKKYKMPKAINNYLRLSRYILFALFTLVTADWIFSLLTYDARNSFSILLMGNMLPLAALMIMVSFIYIALFFERPFCNYFCIQGAKYGLFSSLRLFIIKRDSDKCINCKKCDAVCPMQIKVSTTNQLRNIQCINCLQCTAKCPIDDTLAYKIISLNKKEIAKLLVIAILGILVYSSSQYYVAQSEEKLTSTSIDTIAELSSSESNCNNHRLNQTTSSDIGLLSTDEVKLDEVQNETPSKDNNNQSQDTEIESTSYLYKDGTFYGTARGFRGNMTVEVKILSDKVISVTVVEHVDDRKWFNWANKSIPKQIIANQSTDVDVVSGATYTSYGIINGAAVAIENAKK